MKTFARFGIFIFIFGLLLAAVTNGDAHQATTTTYYQPYFDLVVDEARGRIYGSQIASDMGGNYRTSIDVYDINNLEKIGMIAVGAQPAGMDISSDDNELAVALFGQGEIAFVDLDSQTVTERLVPAVSSDDPNLPFDVIYGTPGRLYSVGNPDSSGLDYIHVIDTINKTEIGKSDEVIRGAPRLAITADCSTLYVSESSFSPQQIYRFNVSTDTPQQTAVGPHGDVLVDNFAIDSDGSRVFTSAGQVWSGDLSTLLSNLPVVYGSDVAYVDSLKRLFFSTPDGLDVFDADQFRHLVTFPMEQPGVLQTSGGGQWLHIALPYQLQSIRADFNPAAVYLPVAIKARPPRGIFGRVSWSNQDKSDIPMQLRYYDGSSWSTAATTMTGEDGIYSFTDINSLEPGQYYYVRYLNETYNTGNVYYYATRTIDGYQKGAEVDMGNMNIQNIQLNSPAAGANVSLPANFTWTVRQATPDDSYEFDLYDLNSDLMFYTDPPLGYTGQYNLSALPSGFSYNKYYYWEIWVYDPLGGYGISFDAYAVKFSGSGSSPQIEIQPEKVPTYLNRPLQSRLDIGQ